MAWHSFRCLALPYCRECNRRSSTFEVWELGNPANPESDNRVEIDLEEVERRAQVFRAVDNLPEDQRRVIVMRFAEEKSIREIADHLGRSEGAVKQLQFRGLEHLRQRLTEK